MPDPFASLRIPAAPVDPDPAFAAGLRSRLERALQQGEAPRDGRAGDGDRQPATPGERGSTMSDPAVGASAVIVPYLAVSGAVDAIAWYGQAFGARLVDQPIVMRDGRIGHAELEIGTARLMLSEEHPEIDVAAPPPGQGVSVTLHLEVADVDAVVENAVRHGARLERPAADFEYGRNGVLRDPYGHRWMVSGPLSRPPLHHGDLGYVSLWVGDVGRAAAFYSTVLGWRYGPGSGPESLQVEGLSLSHGLFGGIPEGTLFLCMAVDDVDAAVRRVRAAGGTAEEPHPEPYGRISGCTDDQGTRFALVEVPGGVATAPRHLSDGARTGRHEGDLAYVTMEVVDSGAARAFYGSVLGWRFSPGRVADGWQVDEVNPMIGLSGGHAAATTVPMYRVDDVEAAVRRTREAGGRASEPERQPYGISATCADDQGTRFSLGQL